MARKRRCHDLNGSRSSAPSAARSHRSRIAGKAASAATKPVIPGFGAGVTVTAPRTVEDVEIALNGQKVPTYLSLGRNALPGSVAGLPGLVLPAGFDERGLPVGLELDGPEGGDRGLIGLGIAVEKALGPIPAPAV